MSWGLWDAFEAYQCPVSGLRYRDEELSLIMQATDIDKIKFSRE
jgi:hypothetical protein